MDRWEVGGGWRDDLDLHHWLVTIVYHLKCFLVHVYRETKEEEVQTETRERGVMM